MTLALKNACLCHCWWHSTCRWYLGAEKPPKPNHACSELMNTALIKKGASNKHRITILPAEGGSASFIDCFCFDLSDPLTSQTCCNFNAAFSGETLPKLLLPREPVLAVAKNKRLVSSVPFHEFYNDEKWKKQTPKWTLPLRLVEDPLALGSPINMTSGCWVIRGWYWSTSRFRSSFTMDAAVFETIGGAWMDSESSSRRLWSKKVLLSSLASTWSWLSIKLREIADGNCAQSLNALSLRTMLSSIMEIWGVEKEAVASSPPTSSSCKRLQVPDVISFTLRLLVSWLDLTPASSVWFDEKIAILGGIMAPMVSLFSTSSKKRSVTAGWLPCLISFIRPLLKSAVAVYKWEAMTIEKFIVPFPATASSTFVFRHPWQERHFFDAAQSNEFAEPGLGRMNLMRRSYSTEASSRLWEAVWRRRNNPKAWVDSHTMRCGYSYLH